MIPKGIVLPLALYSNCGVGGKNMTFIPDVFLYVLPKLSYTLVNPFEVIEVCLVQVIYTAFFILIIFIGFRRII